MKVKFLYTSVTVKAMIFFRILKLQAVRTDILQNWKFRLPQQIHDFNAFSFLRIEKAGHKQEDVRRDGCHEK